MTHPLPLPDFTHERVEVTTGPRSGLVITVALHSSALGSALGGARLWTYPHWSDAVGDVKGISKDTTTAAARHFRAAVAVAASRAAPLSHSHSRKAQPQQK